jgi:hypothetical protein
MLSESDVSPRGVYVYMIFCDVYMILRPSVPSEPRGRDPAKGKWKMLRKVPVAPLGPALP